MQTIKRHLNKRRHIALYILLGIAIVSLVVAYYYTPLPPSYIDVKYHMLLVYLLIGYKIIELGLFYLLLYKKQYNTLRHNAYADIYLKKFEKKAKKFFFLVPQGSIVFGLLSYKLSSEILYLWLFLAMAAALLWFVNPKKLV